MTSAEKKFLRQHLHTTSPLQPNMFGCVVLLSFISQRNVPCITMKNNRRLTKMKFEGIFRSVRVIEDRVGKLDAVLVIKKSDLACKMRVTLFLVDVYGILVLADAKSKPKKIVFSFFAYHTYVRLTAI